jgi:hypothetical protein
MPFVRSFGESETTELASRYGSARPFPHLVIDDFLAPEARDVLADFPGPDWPHWGGFSDGYQLNKRYCADITVMPAGFAALIEACSRPAFLAWLETVTGLAKLIPDPCLDGGGLHASGPGGVLAPHSDFHVYERLGLYRQVNLLIYLNPQWTQADGGALQLFEVGASLPCVSAPPVFGRAVLFRTDNRSIHGFTDPVAEGRWRRSVALYYYSSREGRPYAGDTRTHWRSRGALTGARRALYEGLMVSSKAVSKLAHLIDPNR